MFCHWHNYQFNVGKEGGETGQEAGIYLYPLEVWPLVCLLPLEMDVDRFCEVLFPYSFPRAVLKKDTEDLYIMNSIYSWGFCPSFAVLSCLAVQATGEGI